MRPPRRPPKTGALDKQHWGPCRCHPGGLAALQKQHSVHVLPNSRGDGPADLKKGIAAIFDAAGLPDVRSHTLRRTFASIGDELGFSEPTIGSLLGHASRSVTAKHYIRRPDTALGAAATRIAEQIEMLLGEQPRGELKILDRPSRPDAAGLTSTTPEIGTRNKRGLI